MAKLDYKGEVCPKCNTYKLKTGYYQNKGRSHNMQTYCKECTHTYQKVERREATNKIGRDYYHRHGKYKKQAHTYGLTLEQLRELYLKADYKCEACGNRGSIGKHTIDGLFWTLAVDHDHVTDEVRGLLCRECNLALGLLQDDTIRIENLLKYLKEK